MVTELDLTVTKHVDECRHRTRAFLAFQLVKPRRLVDTNGLHHDFEKTGNETCAGSGLRLVQERSQSGVCSSFGETENEVHDEECCKLAWLGARRILARCGHNNIDRLEELEQVAPLLVETAKAHRRVESKGMTVTEMELKTLLSKKKKTGRYLERSELELALPRNLEKEKSTEKGEAPGQDQGECRDGEKPPRKRRASISTGNHLRRTKIPSLLLSLRRPGGVKPIRETTLGGVVEKHENRLCWWNVDLAKETGKFRDETEERERLTGSNHSRCI